MSELGFHGVVMGKSWMNRGFSWEKYVVSLGFLMQSVKGDLGFPEIGIPQKLDGLFQGKIPSRNG